MPEAQQLDRRTILRVSLFGVAGALLPVGCAGGGADRTALQLPRVSVEERNIARLIAGLRPYRRSGFVVRRQLLADKIVVHNYGHGGCGVSLSWGCAAQAVRLASDSGTRRAAVLGCGALGLATARQLQLEGYEVTIYARDLPPNTTSNVAAAMWAPVTLDDPAYRTPEYVAQASEACRLAFARFQTMVGQKYAVRYVDMFFVGQDPQSIPWDYLGIDDLTPLTPLNSGENPFPTAYASKFETLMIESGPYLQAVFDDFLLMGGRVVVGELSSQAAVLSLPEDLIFNCTGLGAKELFDDEELEPIKGQLTILRPQPQVQYGYVDGRKDLYMFPRSDGIILGGSHQEGVWSTVPDPAEATRIFNAHKQFFAGMK